MARMSFPFHNLIWITKGKCRNRETQAKSGRTDQNITSSSLSWHGDEGKQLLHQDSMGGEGGWELQKMRVGMLRCLAVLHWYHLYL